MTNENLPYTEAELIGAVFSSVKPPSVGRLLATIRDLQRQQQEASKLRDFAHIALGRHHMLHGSSSAVIEECSEPWCREWARHIQDYDEAVSNDKA